MTINIIKKWENLNQNFFDENLNQNFFDENLNYTEDPSKQISVIEAIKRSSDILPDKIENLSSTLRAMNQITTKFFNSERSDYKPYHNIQEKIAKRLIASYFYTEIRDVLESIVQENVDKELLEQQNSRFRPNIEQLEEQFRSLNEGLLNKISEIISNNESSRSKGFLYEIINEKNTSSYLIGTLHFIGGENFLKNTSIKEKVIQSSEFISEMGDCGLQFKAVDIMDDILVRLANSNKSTIHALETLEDRKEASSSNIPKFFTEEELKKKGCLKRYEEYRSIYLVQLDQKDAWNKGDLDHLKKIQKIYTKLTGSKEIVKKRNMNWLSGKRVNLLDKIKQAEKPISVAVGASHLFGKTGLLKAFQDQGLKIQQI